MEHISVIVQEILERHTEKEAEITLVADRSSADNDAKVSQKPDEEMLGVAS